MLIEIHGGHPGIGQMKSLARGFVWWPGLDNDVDNIVKDCRECQQNPPVPASAPLHPWKWPTHPSMRLHVDYAGPLEGKMSLIATDSYSK